MGLEWLTVFGIGFILGLRHAFDPDHFVAVSTIASRTGNLVKAAASGLYWGIGHTLTLFIVGMLFISFKATVPETLALSMEMVVGIMLVILGWTTFRNFQKKKIHVHVHQHEEGEPHTHFHSHEETARHDHTHVKKLGQKSLIVGMIHGLAGSGALVLLTMSSLHTVTEAAIYIVVFGVGTIIGMLLFATLIGLPFVLLSKYSVHLEKKLGMLAGIVSIVFGVYFMYEIAFVEGLFSL
jgi:ABC-type nickel/cobalt efflux system permease component RcnA